MNKLFVLIGLLSALSPSLRADTQTGEQPAQQMPEATCEDILERLSQENLEGIYLKCLDQVFLFCEKQLDRQCYGIGVLKCRAFIVSYESHWMQEVPAACNSNK